MKLFDNCYSHVTCYSLNVKSNWQTSLDYSDTNSQ